MKRLKKMTWQVAKLKEDKIHHISTQSALFRMIINDNDIKYTTFFKIEYIRIWFKQLVIVFIFKCKFFFSWPRDDISSF